MPVEDDFGPGRVDTDKLEGLSALLVAQGVQAVGELRRCDVVVLVRNGEDEFPVSVCSVVRLARVVDDLASKLVRCGCPPLGWFTEVNDHTRVHSRPGAARMGGDARARTVAPHGLAPTSVNTPY